MEEYRHFARAAEVCNVTQPGLTIQLKNLEKEIGIQLFDRSKVPLKPTALGMEIIEKAKKILREADEIRDFIIHSKDTLQGQVRLGVISTLSPYLVPLFISAVKVNLPEMHFTIKESHTLQLMQDLETGALDVALMATPTGRPDSGNIRYSMNPLWPTCIPRTQWQDGNFMKCFRKTDRNYCCCKMNIATPSVSRSGSTCYSGTGDIGLPIPHDWSAVGKLDPADDLDGYWNCLLLVLWPKTQYP